jgi:ribose-phosphate pyrophosphokinase
VPLFGCVLQESIRGCDVFLVQPTCPPVNDHLMELLVTIDACRRASARSITAVLPYYGYARADRKTQVCSTWASRPAVAVTAAQAMALIRSFAQHSISGQLL